MASHDHHGMYPEDNWAPYNEVDEGSLVRIIEILEEAQDVVRTGALRQTDFDRVQLEP
eukprot:CAMPEP_0178846832 /NCGR_PEP_ID=MMETSP0746-20121128/18293_1 /TAXON_ID=913974 /ORGANISM="Nitzschia punctata, Strain CCMP561" /LENGTH=57 /DNA_ID=CAMNT_0020511345 /DNA_START=105 /DNA_END=274 /DNA_ORIENTATION=-